MLLFSSLNNVKDFGFFFIFISDLIFLLQVLIHSVLCLSAVAFIADLFFHSSLVVGIAIDRHKWRASSACVYVRMAAKLKNLRQTKYYIRERERKKIVFLAATSEREKTKRIRVRALGSRMYEEKIVRLGRGKKTVWQQSAKMIDLG